MTSLHQRDVSRREFLKRSGASAAGLALVVNLPAMTVLSACDSDVATSASLGPWILIEPDESVTIYLGQAEMGQGVYTGLPQILADELDIAWDQIRVKAAYGAEEFQTNLNGYVAQFVGGSLSTSKFYLPLRQSGAAARQMLTQAAANRWSVSASDCYTEQGVVKLKDSDNVLSYGVLALEASELSVPESPNLKKKSEFSFIGKSMPKLDTAMKSNGSAVFGIDVQIPEMLYATAKASPVMNGAITSYNEDEVLALPGIRGLVHVPLNYNFSVPDSVIVVADSYWQAKRGADALELIIDGGYNQGVSTESLKSAYEEGMQASGSVAVSVGDAKSAIENAEISIEAEYDVPYLAHAPLEPMNATASVKDGKAEIWAPIQNQSYTHYALSETLKLDFVSIAINTTFLGGGFGRRTTPEFVVQAALASQAVGMPVKLIWSREEDMRQDNYRQAYSARLKGGIDDKGNLLGLDARVVAQSLFGQIMPDAVQNGVDESTVEGLSDPLYDFENLYVDTVNVEAYVPLGWWRTIGRGPNAFFLESFLDELAHAGQRDPYELRRDLMQKNPRGLAVLDAAASAAGWGVKSVNGHFQGIAYHPYIARDKTWTTHAAHVVEVSVSESGVLKIHRIFCALDCGTVVNPRLVEAMIESSVVFGLTAALKSEITFKDGVVDQSNFHDYRMLKMAEMPEIETVILESDEVPGGTGEAPMPPLAPALTNAIFAATGKRIRSLPIEKHDLRST